MNHLSDKAIFCRNIYIHTPDSPIARLEEFGLALMGVPEDRGADMSGPGLAPDLIRHPAIPAIQGKSHPEDH